MHSSDYINQLSINYFYGYSPLWLCVCVCVVKWAGWVNDFWQMGHWNNSSPMWLPLCLVKAQDQKTSFHSRSIGMTFLHCEFVYALPNEQDEKMPSDRGSNGKVFFLYECKCALNSPEDLNVFGHREQWNGCSSLWILLCIFKFPN